MNHFEKKDPTWSSYESSAEAYAKNVEGLHPHKEADRFLSMLPCGGSILDIGCGSGRDAKLFSEKGFNVTGIDYSPSMIDIAAKTAPKATFKVMDMQCLNFEHAFDGAWANASLLHIPKSHFPKILGEIYNILNPNGVFYIALKQGDKEGVELDTRYGSLQKFFSYFEENELRTFLTDAGFRVIDLFKKDKEFSYQTHPSIMAYCKKIS